MVATQNLFHHRGVGQTYKRPYVSNDNPFSEPESRTLQYRPNYPAHFPALGEARAHLGGYVPWCNIEHKNSGFALFSPAQVHDRFIRRGTVMKQSY